MITLEQAFEAMKNQTKLVWVDTDQEDFISDALEETTQTRIYAIGYMSFGCNVPQPSDTIELQGEGNIYGPLSSFYLSDQHYIDSLVSKTEEKLTKLRKIQS